MAIPKNKNPDSHAIYYYNESQDTYPAWEGDVGIQVGGSDVSSSNPVPTTGQQITLETSGVIDANGEDAYSGDVSKYAYVTIQVIGTWSGTISVQFSHNNSDFDFVSCSRPANPTLLPEETIRTNGLYVVSVFAKYFRVRSTAWTSGSATVYIRLSSFPISLPIVSGQVSVIGSSPPGAALNANPVAVGGRAATLQPTAVSDAQVVNVMLDEKGRMVPSTGQIRQLSGYACVTLTNNSETELIPAAGSGVYTDITTLIVAQTSSGVINCTLRDSLAGTTVAVFCVLANSTVTVSFPQPLPSSASNSQWTIQSSDASGNYTVTAVYVKNT